MSKYADMDDRWDELIPLNDALRYAGIGGRYDKWERFVDWGLMRKAETIPHTNHLGITRRRAERLRQILALEAALPGRATKIKLTFWVAFKGAEILKPEHALTYIDVGIHQFFSSFRREARRLAPGYDFSDLRAGPQTKKLGGQMARQFLKQVPALDDPTRLYLSQNLTQILTLLFEVVFTDVPARSLATRLRPIAFNLLNSEASARIFAEEFAKFLIAHGAELRDPDRSQNATLNAVQTASRDNPSAILTGIRAAHVLVERVKGVVMSDRAARIPTATVQPYQIPQTDRFFYSMVAMIAGNMVQMSLNPNYERFFRKLFGGERIAIEDMFDELIQAYPQPVGGTP